jgi:hypothetical protein
MIRRALLLALFIPAAAMADSVTLEVGATRKVNVGMARGLFCDDNTIVAGSIATDESGQANIVTLTGLSPGSTLCRAGDVALGATRVISVTVTKAKPKQPAKQEPPGDGEKRDD